jgi:PHD/YefM family antitoxin component YafN of YafNO toxin-antitoxin module
MKSNIFELWKQLSFMESDTVSISKKEYEDLLEYMERMRETIEVLSNEVTVKKLNDALERVERGEFLTKKEMRFGDL